MPICVKCNSAFPNRARIDGISKVLSNRSACLTCSPFKSAYHRGRVSCRSPEEKKLFRDKKTNKWQTKSRRERKAKLVAMLGGKCSSCGYSKYQGALDFHHIDPSNKTFTIGNKGMLSKWDDLVIEANKCVLLCRNCHAESHAGIELVRS